MTEEDAVAEGFTACRVETWQEEMARYERDPEALRRRKAEGQAVAKMLREKGVDLPIVIANPYYPIGDQIGREARVHDPDAKSVSVTI